MLQKLKNTSGETFIEALAALLIMGFSTVLFIGLVMAAKNVNMIQKEADVRFYAAMEKVEVLEGTNAGGNPEVIQVKISNGNGMLLETIDCQLTEADHLRAYEIKKP